LSQVRLTRYYYVLCFVIGKASRRKSRWKDRIYAGEKPIFLKEVCQERVN